MTFWKLTFIVAISTALGAVGMYAFTQFYLSPWELRTNGQLMVRMDRRTGKTQMMYERIWRDIKEQPVRPPDDGSAAHFSAALRCRREAFNLAHNSDTNWEEFSRFLRAAYTESKLVSNDYLTKLDKDLPQIFYKSFKALDDLSINATDSDASKAAISFSNYGAFDAWIKKHPEQDVD